MGRLVIGSHNKKKLVELGDLLGDLPFEVVNLDSFASVEDVEETGTTFEENARLKAVAYAKATGEWTLAEDSGVAPSSAQAHRSGLRAGNRAGRRLARSE